MSSSSGKDYPPPLSPRNASHAPYSSDMYSPSSSAGGPPVSPARKRSEEYAEYDHQQSSINLLKAQLKLVTHERDMLKKDLKRDPSGSVGTGYKHLPFTAATGGSFYESVHHHRTSSDTAAPPTNKAGLSSNLSRSHSIASAGDKSLMTVRSPSGGGSDVESPKNEQKIIHELQVSRKKQSDALKKLEQALKDKDYYHGEAENYRSRYNDVLVDKQRLEQEVNSLRLFREDDRKEMQELRRQQQEVLNSEGGEPLSIMYGTLLRNYEAVKDEYTLIRKRYDDLVASHSAADAKIEHAQDEILRYKKLYQDMLTERNQFKQQCTQAIRQWDQALRERNDYKEALTKVQRQHEEAVKEVNEAMNVRIRASKDVKRLTQERNAAMQEYSLIMSERDSVHKEIEKLQDEVNITKKKMSLVESKTKMQDDERRKLLCSIEMLKREVDQSLQERDKALKEAHELREKMGVGKATSEYDSNKSVNRNRFDLDKHKKDRDSASTETLDLHGSQANLVGSHGKKGSFDNLESANGEIDRLRKLSEKLQGELQDATMEADVAKGRRDWAFSERDKVVLERESIRTLCDKLRRERDRAVSELAEALRDSDDVKKQLNETLKETKELKEKLESLEKEARLKSLQRSTDHSHSHDSAIDSDLQEWDTENIDLDMNGLGPSSDLGLDLSGGKDDLHCQEPKPIYISSIDKGSFLDGKLKVNDCILRVNNVDCRDLERATILHALKAAATSGSASQVSLLIKRRKPGRRYTAVLHLSPGQDHGLTLDLGVYISRIQPGSVAAKEGGIAVGDRIVNINDHPLEGHVHSLGDAVKLLNQTNDVISLTVAKTVTPGSANLGPLSSSSSGHNMQEKLDEEKTSHKSTMSPIKDTIRGSQEFVKKLFPGSGVIKGSDRYSSAGGIVSSSSSEKVYQVTKSTSSKESKSPFGLMKEKFDTVRGRRRSKELLERPEEEMCPSRDPPIHDDDPAHHDPAPKDHHDLVLAELDSVLNSYHSGGSGSGSGTKSNGNKKKRSSFRSGGTWPRTRGGPVIEHTTGTIIHPQKMKKERLPLSELLTNLPKYPIETPPSSVTSLRNSGTKGVVYRNDQPQNRSTREARKTRPATSYNPEYLGHPASIPPSRESSVGDQLDRAKAGYEQRAAFGGALSPSDTSIDESVKSAQGKEVLQMYLKKKSSSHGASDADILSPAELLSPPPPLTLSGSQSSYSALKQINPHLSTLDHHPLVRPSASCFSPYFSPPQLPQPSAAIVSAASAGISHPIMHHALVSSSPRYSSPPPLLQGHAQSGDSLLGSPIPDYRSSEMQRLYQYESAAPNSLSSVSPTAGLFHHSPSPSVDIYGSSKHRGSSLLSNAPVVPPYSMSSAHHLYSAQGHSQVYRDDPVSPPHYPTEYSSSRSRIGKENIGTRIRIPSNTSVGSFSSNLNKNSTSSIDRPLSKCGSPLPIVSVQVITPNGHPEPTRLPRKPALGEIRLITIEKSSVVQLGIMIDEGANKGIFVSSVSQNSLASQVGLQIGDQLLDVCGINLRICDKEQAARVLQNVGNNVTMKVQYNPEDFRAMSEDSSPEESDYDSRSSSGRVRRREGSGSPTPRNSPKSSRHDQSSFRGGQLNPSLPPSAHSTLTRHQISRVVPKLNAPSRGVGGGQAYEPRLVFPTLKKSGDLGVRLVGGNAVGIFIHSVEIDSAAFESGLRSADQILEYNAVDLRSATAEQAAYELAKPAEKVSILVQYNPAKYDEIKDRPGDSYYVRAMFDRLPEYTSDRTQLNFIKDDILYVDNTMYNGVPGHWSAWVVDQNGQRTQWGIIPSKYKVEEELLMKRSLGELEVDGSRLRTWTTTRRSFFKRKKGARSSSREGKELASYSDVASLSYSDSGTLHEDPPISSYIRVQKLDYMVTRPILILGPLADAVTDKLISDYPHKFSRCEPEYMSGDQDALEKGVMDNILVDFRRRGSHFECTTVSAIKEVADRNQHCILNIHLEAVERLHHNQIYPIVLLIKFKSVKQIKEVKDPRYHAEKISQKDAKNIFEYTQKLEAEYKPLISDTIHGGANFMLMAAQIATKIESEQNKTLWVPSGSTIW